MKSRKIGNKMGEDCRDSRHKFGVNEANASHSNNSETRTKTQEPVDGDLVLDIKLILLDGAIVPDVHDDHEDEGENYGYPRSF